MIKYNLEYIIQNTEGERHESGRYVKRKTK